MKVQINGKEREFAAKSVSVEEMLAELALGYPVLVELNGEALFKREFSERQVQNGDRVELMRMVAGG